MGSIEAAQRAGTNPAASQGGGCEHDGGQAQNDRIMTLDAVELAGKQRTMIWPGARHRSVP